MRYYLQVHAGLCMKKNRVCLYVIPSARLGSKLPFNKTCPNRNHILVLRAIERLDVGFVLFIAICGVCVEDGWFEQPHLARVRLIGLWGWVRLHT